MAGVWAKDGHERWRPLIAAGFTNEAELHSLIEESPAMLPLPGAPTLAVEPDRTQVTAELAGTGKPPVPSRAVPGAAEFAASL